MKIRFGFVSNSSSSSFIIVGKALQFNELDRNDLKHIYAVCPDSNEGELYISLTKEIYDYIQNHNIQEEFTYIREFKLIDCEESVKLYRSQLPEEFELVPIFISYNSVESLEDFIEYCKGEDLV